MTCIEVSLIDHCGIAEEVDKLFPVSYSIVIGETR